MNSPEEENLQSQLKSLQQEGLAFFGKSARVLEGIDSPDLIYLETDYYWSKISQDLRAEAHKVIADLIPLAQKIAVGCKAHC